MKYKVIIKSGGQFETTVIDAGKHHCGDIVNVVNSFGSIDEVKDKKDDVPVKNNINVGRGHV